METSHDIAPKILPFYVAKLTACQNDYIFLLTIKVNYIKTVYALLSHGYKKAGKLQACGLGKTEISQK